MENKNRLIVNCVIVGVIVIGVVVAVVLIVFMNNKTQLTNELEKAGRDFYENYYYDQAGSDDKTRSEFLVKLESAGIKVNLENLARSTENNKGILDKFVNKATGKKCNTDNTKVIIYPKDPYGKKDYIIETEIDCGFDK